MSESTIERNIREFVEKKGGLCIKLQNLTTRGFPDRTILFPRGLILFMEVKDGKKGNVSRHQRTWRRALMLMGFPCVTVKSLQEAITEIERHCAI